MSKFILSPQIKQLRAANAGQVALADGGLLAIGKVSVAFAAQLAAKAINLSLVDALIAHTLADGGSHSVGAAFFTEVINQSNIAIALSLVNAIEPVTATPAESPAIGVAIFTSVS